MFLVGTKKIALELYQRYSTLDYLCAMSLNNILECQVFSAFNFKGVEQHDGGEGPFYQRKT